MNEEESQLKSTSIAPSFAPYARKTSAQVPLPAHGRQRRYTVSAYRNTDLRGLEEIDFIVYSRGKFFSVTTFFGSRQSGTFIYLVWLNARMPARPGHAGIHSGFPLTLHTRRVNICAGSTSGWPRGKDRVGFLLIPTKTSFYFRGDLV